MKVFWNTAAIRERFILVGRLPGKRFFLIAAAVVALAAPVPRIPHTLMVAAT